MTFAVLRSAYAVFDPIGGIAGAIVSNAACDAFRVAVNAAAGVKEALARANDPVNAAIAGNATLRGAGCAAVAVELSANQATIAWVGDAHLLLLRAGSLHSLTRAHSVLNSGAIPPAEAAKLSSSERGELSRAITRSPPARAASRSEYA